MRYFDDHLHLKSANREGLEALLRYLDSEPDLVGGNLVLNTPEELEVAVRHRAELPTFLQLVPFLPLTTTNDVLQHSTAGWFKVHPTLAQISLDRIEDVLSAVGNARQQIRGLLVHAFPWTDRLEYSTSLELVIALARRFKDLPIVVTHGGGYDSWRFRAHASGFPNVHFDFSLSLTYFRGTDYLIPMVHYFQKRRERIHFGSDWPSATAQDQLAEAVRLAATAGLPEQSLEATFLQNGEQLWPGFRRSAG